MESGLRVEEIGGGEVKSGGVEYCVDAVKVVEVAKVVLVLEEQVGVTWTRVVAIIGEVVTDKTSGEVGVGPIMLGESLDGDSG